MNKELVTPVSISLLALLRRLPLPDESPLINTVFNNKAGINMRKAFRTLDQHMKDGKLPSYLDRTNVPVLQLATALRMGLLDLLDRDVDEKSAERFVDTHSLVENIRYNIYTSKLLPVIFVPHAVIRQAIREKKCPDYFSSVPFRDTAERDRLRSAKITRVPVHPAQFLNRFHTFIDEHSKNLAPMDTLEDRVDLSTAYTAVQLQNSMNIPRGDHLDLEGMLDLVRKQRQQTESDTTDNDILLAQIAHLLFPREFLTTFLSSMLEDQKKNGIDVIATQDKNLFDELRKNDEHLPKPTSPSKDSLYSRLVSILHHDDSDEELSDEELNSIVEPLATVFRYSCASIENYGYLKDVYMLLNQTCNKKKVNISDAYFFVEPGDRIEPWSVMLNRLFISNILFVLTMKNGDDKDRGEYDVLAEELSKNDDDTVDQSFLDDLKGVYFNLSVSGAAEFSRFSSSNILPARQEQSWIQFVTESHEDAPAMLTLKSAEEKALSYARRAFATLKFFNATDRLYDLYNHLVSNPQNLVELAMYSEDMPPDDRDDYDYDNDGPGPDMAEVPYPPDVNDPAAAPNPVPVPAAAAPAPLKLTAKQKRQQRTLAARNVLAKLAAESKIMRDLPPAPRRRNPVRQVRIKSPSRRQSSRLKGRGLTFDWDDLAGYESLSEDPPAMDSKADSFDELVDFSPLAGSKRLRGGALGPPGPEFAAAEAHELSGEDMRRITGWKIVKYADLDKYKSMADLGKAIVLFETAPGTGHWCVFYDRDGVGTLFDPLGLAADAERKFVAPDTLEQLGETVPQFQRLLSTADSIDVSHFKAQKNSPGIDTCGRWCGMRAIHFPMSNAEFQHEMEQAINATDLNNDEWITTQIN